LTNHFAGDSIYRIAICNKLKEVQHTNLASLIVVDHREGTKALMDAQGRVHIVKNLEPPIQASTVRGENQYHNIYAADESAFSFNDDDSSPDEQGLLVTFHRPSHATTGRLVLRLKNSFWFDHVYGQFTQLFGTGYNLFTQHLRAWPTTNMKQWAIEQNVPLTISVKQNSEWRIHERLECVGPLASRETVTEIDLSNIDDENITIRLSTGYLFWEIDYLAMDFEGDESFSSRSVVHSSAIDQTGVDVGASLLHSDDQYLVQPSIGDEAVITYRVPPKNVKHAERSVFLHSRGYYEYVRDFKNPPEVMRLLEFKRPGQLAQFSRELLDALSHESKDEEPSLSF
jgi:hypothetical protein